MNRLMGMMVYDGEKVSHWTVCETHFTAYMEAGDFHAQMDDAMELDSECIMCETEQTPIHCSICGGETEHNWETHIMELRNG